MAKTKISEWSTTPASNTDIDGINIAEGCAPSGINDAIRDLMAQVRSWQSGASGDPFNGPMNGTIGATTAYSGAFTTLSASGTTTLSGLTASTALALDASKNVVSVANTGSGSNVLATSPTLVTPALGTPSSATLTNATGLPISTGVSGLGTGVATALAVNVGSAGAPVVNGGALGTPSSGTVTNLTGTASININGTVGATTPTTGAFTTTTVSTSETLSYGTANGVTYLNGSKVLTSGSALTFDGTVLNVGSATFPSGRIRLKQADDTTKQKGLLIETAADDSLLAIGYNSGAFTYNATYNSTGSYQPQAWWVSGSEGMRLTSTGLGIGTSSPAGKLDVTGRSYFRASGSNTVLTLLNTSGGDGNIVVTGTSTTMNYSFNTYSTGSALYIQNDGNVGIGTSSPISNSGYGGFSLNGTSGALLSMMTAGTESSRIASLGDLTSIQSKATTGYITFVQGVSGGTERARIDSSGNLLVGTTTNTPAQSNVSGFKVGGGQIECNGSNTQAAFFGRSNDGQVVRFYNAGSAAGNISNTSTVTTYNGTSDYRLKENIQPMEGGLEKILALKPVTYTWKNDGRFGQGFIAHELQEVIPDAVQGEKDAIDENGNPEYQGIDPRMIVATLTAAIQELKAEFDAYKASHP